MAQLNHKTSHVVIDEDGDTVLILQDPIENLKTWPTSLARPDPKTGLVQGNPYTVGAPWPAITPIDSRSNSQVTRPPKREVRYQVSSTQLENVSQYFRNIFSGRFSESVVDPVDRKYHVKAKGFHPMAMEHVLNIIHVRNRRLPKRVHLELLAHIAVLIDYYGLHDAVSFHTEIWAKYVARKKLPEDFCRDLVLRTFVARAFGDKKNLVRGAELIVRIGTAPIPDIGIPLLDLADILDECRGNIIKDVIDNVDQLPNLLKDRELGCSDECRENLLDSFVKKRSMRLWGPTFNGCEYPFHGVSYEKLTSGLLSCAELESHYIDLGSRIHLCDLYDLVMAAINVGEQRLEALLKGLAK